mgnify:FL=1
MRFWLGFIFVVATLLSGCTRVDVPLPRDELVVALRDTPAFVQEDGGGFERELIERFAREQGLGLRTILVHDHDELISLLRAGKAHMAASAMVLENTEGVRYSHPLRRAGQLLVQSSDSVDLDDPSELAGKSIEVLEGSPEDATLKELNARHISDHAVAKV